MKSHCPAGALGSGPGRLDGFADLEAVVLVERVVELGVGVEVLLPRVRIGGVHVVGDRARNRLAISAVFGPFRDRVAQALADHTLEGLAVLGAVKTTEQVVKRAILEQDQNDVVQSLRALITRLLDHPATLTPEISLSMQSGTIGIW